MPAPYALYAPLMNFAGFNGPQPSSIPAYKWYNEGITSALFPRDLYTAQLLARIGTLPTVSTGGNTPTYQSPGYGCSGCTKCLINTSNATMAKCPASYTCERGVGSQLSCGKGQTAFILRCTGCLRGVAVCLERIISTMQCIREQERGITLA
jgi:hypothetical protein